MLPVYYASMNFASVDDLADLYHSGLPEMNRVKAVIEACKNLFKLPTDRVKLQVAEGERIYKIILLSPDIKKYTFGWIVLMPLDKRVDIYNAENSLSPLLQYKNKKLVNKGYGLFLDKAGLDRLFDRIINAAA